ncbi:galactosyl transferase GMA12/MNN10 family-domain-containing protein [Peziza echinospora]|nr:galactosyl transferase GMA12/MNN10 family-domain-containing protein [Peziza echinospora]
MARLVNTCVLAAIVIFLFVTFTAFFHTGTSPSVLLHGGGVSSVDKPTTTAPTAPGATTIGSGKPNTENQKDKGSDNKDADKHAGDPPNKPPVSPVPPPMVHDPSKPKVVFPGPSFTFNVDNDIVYNPEGPTPDQIVLLAASDGGGHNNEIPNMLQRTEENRIEYAKLHGYIYQFINITKYDLQGASPVWAKLPAIIDTFNHYPQAQWVWWLDSDAIIMSPEYDIIKSLLNEKALAPKLVSEALHAPNRAKSTLKTPTPQFKDIDFISAQDQNGLNAGSFFIRRSQFSRWLLDIWGEQMLIKLKWQGEEQTVIQHLVYYHQSIRERFGFVRMREFNAYAAAAHNTWQKGDLAIHFAGCWVDHVCASRFEEFWNKRTTVKQLLEAGQEREKEKEKEEAEKEKDG